MKIPAKLIRFLDFFCELLNLETSWEKEDRILREQQAKHKNSEEESVLD